MDEHYFEVEIELYGHIQRIEICVKETLEELQSNEKLLEKRIIKKLKEELNFNLIREL